MAESQDPQPRLWMRLSQHVLDARGRAVRCLSFNDVQRLARQARGRIDIPALRASTRRRPRSDAIVLVVTGLWLVFGIASIDGPQGLRIVWFASGVPVGALGIATAARQARRTPALLRALLAARICPHCAYDLDGLTDPESDTVTCPECSCAWRIETGDRLT